MSAKHNSQSTPKPGLDKLLGELELAIMRIAWGRKSVTVREVHTQLTKKRSLAYTTVMTVMSRLAEKGLLVAEKNARSYKYQAALTQSEFGAHKARQVARSLIEDFGGEVALSQFVKELSATSPEQLARLAELARLAQEAENES